MLIVFLTPGANPIVWVFFSNEIDRLPVLWLSGVMQDKLSRLLKTQSRRGQRKHFHCAETGTQCPQSRTLPCTGQQSYNDGESVTKSWKYLGVKNCILSLFSVAEVSCICNCSFLHNSYAKTSFSMLHSRTPWKQEQLNIIFEFIFV